MNKVEKGVIIMEIGINSILVIGNNIAMRKGFKLRIKLLILFEIRA